MSFAAPPKHDPVVIKLGQDSDSDESDASDTESGKKTTTTTTTITTSKGSGGGLFGGLEMMIKEARKSAEVSVRLTLVIPHNNLQYEGQLNEGLPFQTWCPGSLLCHIVD